jgi:ankyrin repeat protein
LICEKIGIVYGSFHCEILDKISIPSLRSTVAWNSPSTTNLNKLIADICKSNVISLDARIKSLNAEENKEILLDDKNTSILLKACVNNSSVACMERILKCNCPVDAVEQSTGDTALHMACKKDNIEFVSLLIAYRSSIKILNGENKLPEDYVTTTGLKHYFQLLRNQKGKDDSPVPQDPSWWGDEFKCNPQISFHKNLI